jgi:hypothetical protein
MNGDNYLAPMPGERRIIHIVLENADTRGKSLRVVVEGYQPRQR